MAWLPTDAVSGTINCCLRQQAHKKYQSVLPRHLRSFVVAQHVHSLAGSFWAFLSPLQILNTWQPPSQPYSSFSAGCHSFHAFCGQQDELPTENLHLRVAAEELKETGDDAVSEALKTMTSGKWLTHLFTFPHLHTSAACLVVCMLGHM